MRPRLPLPARQAAASGGSVLMELRIDDLNSPETRKLLKEHLQWMARVSPPESRHALDIDGLRRPDITCWSAWDGSCLAGFGALKELDSTHGEIKSMRTTAAFRRKGVAVRLLEHIIDEARGRGYARLSLETGSMPYFEAARRLYARFGFEYCAPFADYVADPNSVFMTRKL